ncbi:T9SS type A sorting domain-containing protein [Flavivirga jejuensis]|uniref:T9SS type A sorting domain-containing protein n=1 Tax=Flavivirga jejuensis TaxID=870487 RepID=A0ABT8WJU1_9FLAO|nr:T9SS type A sorting domain-containing protein [Flavivirga jejuensis]MDO5973431.1 T9SS type A sorting domain-containing protein [Flavivirga jejuensis]
MKTKLLIAKQNSYTFYTLLVCCLCFNYGWSQTNLVLNGTGDLFTITQDDADANGWNRNDSDNADAFDMSPPSTVVYDADAKTTNNTSPSPYRALWNNGDLDTWLATNCGDNSEIPGSSSDGNFDYSAGPTMGVPTRGLKINEACRRLYQYVPVTAGVSYTLLLESRSELADHPSEVYILNTEIADEVGLTSSSSTVDAFLEITNDFNSSKSNATTDNFTKSSLEFTPSGSFIVIYIKSPNTVDSDDEVFYDNIELYETSTLSLNDISTSNFKIYPNPAKDYITIQSKDLKINSIEIFDLLGKSIYSKIEPSDNKINVSNFSKGIYLLKLESEGKSLAKKIVVQ